MNEELNKETDTPEENQEETGDSNETPTEKAEDLESIKKERDSAIAQKDHYRQKYDKAKSAFEEEKKEADTPKEADDANSKIDFLMSNMGSAYTKDDVELISKKAKIDGVTMNEAAEDKDIAEMIEARHKKAKQDNKSLDSNITSFPQPDKPVSEMTDAEHKAYEQKVQEAGKRQI